MFKEKRFIYQGSPDPAPQSSDSGKQNTLKLLDWLKTTLSLPDRASVLDSTGEEAAGIKDSLDAKMETFSDYEEHYKSGECEKSTQEIEEKSPFMLIGSTDKQGFKMSWRKPDFYKPFMRSAKVLMKIDESKFDTDTLEKYKSFKPAIKLFSDLSEYSESDFKKKYKKDIWAFVIDDRNNGKKLYGAEGALNFMLGFARIMDVYKDLENYDGTDPKALDGATIKIIFGKNEDLSKDRFAKVLMKKGTKVPTETPEPVATKEEKQTDDAPQKIDDAGPVEEVSEEVNEPQLPKEIDQNTLDLIVEETSLLESFKSQLYQTGVNTHPQATDLYLKYLEKKYSMHDRGSDISIIPTFLAITEHMQLNEGYLEKTKNHLLLKFYLEATHALIVYQDVLGKNEDESHVQAQIAYQSIIQLDQLFEMSYYNDDPDSVQILLSIVEYSSVANKAELIEKYKLALEQMNE